jgi:hypothetical protein
MSVTRCLIVLCILLFQATAFAQAGQEGAREQASAHFQRGVELFEDGAFRAALVEFERAYEVAPDYRLLYNIAQVRFELQDFIGAVQAYERYLTEGGSAVPEQQRAEVENSLRALRQRAGQISLTVNRDGADVFIDDAEVGKTPIETTIAVNVGRHRVSVRAPDGATAAKIVDVAGGELAEVSLELAAPVREKPAESAGPRGMPLTHKLAIVGWGAGGALLLGSVVTGVLALRADSDLDGLFKRPNQDPEQVSEQRDKVKTLVTTTDVLIATGAALAVTGTALWLFGPRKDSEPTGVTTAKLRWDVGLGSLTMRGQF